MWNAAAPRVHRYYKVEPVDDPQPETRVLSLPRCFALVPAAGTGARMGANLPKQYLLLGHCTLLERTAAVLAAVARIARVVVVTAPDDRYAATLRYDPKVHLAPVGGATRAASVRAGLDALGAESDDWVLVHDAARACLTVSEVDRLIDALEHDAVGGLLACPVADTLKQSDGAGRVRQTVPRDGMWRAATPQMFRLELLRRALDAPGALQEATDESGAVEAIGYAPRLVAGLAGNLKITTQDDLALAAAILAARGELE